MTMMSTRQRSLSIRSGVAVLGILMVGSSPATAVEKASSASRETDCGRTNAGLNGTWVGGDSKLNTVIAITFVPTTPNGGTSFTAEFAQADLTIGGLFPSVSNLQNATIRGEAWRTDAKTYEVKAIFYARDAGQRIVFTSVTSGSITLTGPNTYEEVASDMLYLPEQDRDHDGFPDAGETPILLFTVSNTMKRLHSLP